MFGSDVLEVAIGMAFLFLFMSTIASALREAIEAIWQHRAADLEQGIIEMLRTSDGKNWVESFYDHPLISSLYKGKYKTGDTKRLPAYIPKENFSLAILDLVAGASRAGLILSMKDLAATLAKPAPKVAAATSASTEQSTAVIANASTQQSSAVTSNAAADPQVKTNEAEAEPNAVQRVVLTALAAGQDDIAAVRKELEDWYDGTMDRVSSWYAKRTGKILLAIGFAAAAFLNVDAITIAKSLFLDRPLREAIVAEAEIYARQNAADQKNAVDHKDAADQSNDTQAQSESGAAQPEAPAPRPKAAVAQPEAAAATPDPSATPQSKSFDELQAEFKKLGFPIGWHLSDNLPYPAPQSKCVLVDAKAGTYNCPYDTATYVEVLASASFGWLITAIAIMLGAPFWFDLLNKLISLRSALKPPDEKPGSKQAPSAT